MGRCKHCGAVVSEAAALFAPCPTCGNPPGKPRPAGPSADPESESQRHKLVASPVVQSREVGDD